ncbi:MAG: serine/threonine protein kinase, partial [Planctomycetaceae bacterium]|nr:serine/threonine protein kinase [Planctomycetaceae bacterium]
AEDPLDGTIVAVKVLRTDMARKVDVLKRFHREALLLAEIRNPHVANLLEINNDGDVHFIVLEFVDGSDLLHYLQQHGHLSERAAASVTADVARALCDAHEHGIVHRDLKPENILIQRESSTGTSGIPTEFPRVKLTDFGLARHIHESESMNVTSAGSVLGTPLYLAPEQCTGSTDVDVRADVYSLGATLFHTLIGRPPFEADSVIGLISKHVNELAPRVRSLSPELSEAIDEIVAKCLQKSPSSRYQNAGELLRDLERLLRGEPTNIHAHPRLPDANLKDVLTFDFSWKLNNSPEALWPHVSNTERLNRAIGLPAVDYSTQAALTGGSQRYGQFRKLGVMIGWQEHPFEWVEGRRMAVFREFNAGPWKWFTSVVELTPRGDGGTELSHRIRILPANFIGNTAGKIMGLQTRKSLEQVYRRIDAVLTGELGSLADPFERAHNLSADGIRKLDQRLQKVTRSGVELFVIERFREFLMEAPLQELARIRPLALAKRLSVDEKQLVTVCLIGAREGLLTMLWDIVCPICRIPSQIQDSLKSIQDHGHCVACQSDFELDFANSIEMIFRIATDIQTTDTGVFCIGGPAHSPHVAAQVRLAPAERFELDLTLTDGTYLVRGPQLSYTIPFRVAPRATESRWELTLSRGPQVNLPSELRTGRQLFVFVNDTAHEVVIRIERTVSRGDALTAARAAATPLFRELFPGECLAPDQLVRVEQVTLLFTRLDGADQLYFEMGDASGFARLHEHFRALDTLIRREGGSLIKTVGDGSLAVFTDPVMAVRAALAMWKLAEPQLRIAVHQGPAMVATINDHLDYFGSTISTTAQLLNCSRKSPAGANACLWITNAISRNPQVMATIAETHPDAVLLAIPDSIGNPREGLFAHELQDMRSINASSAESGALQPGSS